MPTSLFVLIVLISLGFGIAGALWGWRVLPRLVAAAVWDSSHDLEEAVAWGYAAQGAGFGICAVLCAVVGNLACFWVISLLSSVTFTGTIGLIVLFILGRAIISFTGVRFTTTRGAIKSDRALALEHVNRRLAPSRAVLRLSPPRNS